MTQGKQLDFSGIPVFCGVDVHKNNWRVNIQDQDFELEDFSQDADVVLLHKHLVRSYPGARFRVCYEAGFCGFSIQRYLHQQGIECLVVNAADVATTDKEKKHKSDKIDARKLCDHLQTKKAKGIYIPATAWEQGRSLVRARQKLVSNQTRTKNRIWQLLHFSGLSLPKAYGAGQYWSKAFVAQLRAMDCGGSTALKGTLELYLRDYEQTKALVLQATRLVRQLCSEAPYQEAIELLRSIPAIGVINAAIILFELQDIHRFRHLDALYSYAGLIPDSSGSGERNVVLNITSRTNRFLRVALVESSWQVIRKDPALLLKYKQYCKRMHKHKAIIRIAKHLLARIAYVLKQQQPYVRGTVGGVADRF
jgi:transposase